MPILAVHVLPNESSKHQNMILGILGVWAWEKITFIPGKFQLMPNWIFGSRGFFDNEKIQKAKMFLNFGELFSNSAKFGKTGGCFTQKKPKNPKK